MSKETDKKKSEVIARLHEINTALASKDTEPLAYLHSEASHVTFTPNSEKLSAQEKKELVGVLCDWDEQRKKNRAEILGVEKKKLENELKGLL